MQQFDLTLPTPAENLAFDEAILEWAEENASRGEFLRLWESPQPMVVVGRSSRVGKEVNEEFCRQEHIPILRRSSGGAAIVTGPGCLMYGLVLSYAVRPELKDITRAHSFILKQLTTAVGPLLSQTGAIACGGTSDLAVESMEPGAGSREPETTQLAPRSSLPAPRSSRKFSGNSLRMKRTHLLYHGTLLYAFDLGLIEKCLRMPPRQPDYRRARPHRDFVMNVLATRQQLAAAVVAAFPMASAPTDVPKSRVTKLVIERFGVDNWNYELP
jgi:lipoate-protein ligase A